MRGGERERGQMGGKRGGRRHLMCAVGSPSPSSDNPGERDSVIAPAGPCATVDVVSCPGPGTGCVLDTTPSPRDLKEYHGGRRLHERRAGGGGGGGAGGGGCGGRGAWGGGGWVPGQKGGEGGRAACLPNALCRMTMPVAPSPSFSKRLCLPPVPSNVRPACVTRWAIHRPKAQPLAGGALHGGGGSARGAVPRRFPRPRARRVAREGRCVRVWAEGEILGQRGGGGREGGAKLRNGAATQGRPLGVSTSGERWGVQRGVWSARRERVAASV